MERSDWPATRFVADADWTALRERFRGSARVSATVNILITVSCEKSDIFTCDNEILKRSSPPPPAAPCNP